MEQAFAEAKGVGKCCGICMENIMEKSLRFGILEGCRHCFCLDCIREWRRNQTFETEVVRSCPECRQHSNFVIPSILWVEEEEEKQILCEVYRNNMAQKQCKYYKIGTSAEGCPFGNKCFYKHQLPDGSIDPGEAPHARRKPHLADFIFQRHGSGSDDGGEESDAASRETLDSWFDLERLDMLRIRLRAMLAE
ncbi:zinc finger, C3HC4 type [Necator americanus]|nr:zinc finger, C3HC4 type [Necator americanus]ETN75070.1 zinc finger, C3HC4 type [Necator americanus]